MTTLLVAGAAGFIRPHFVRHRVALHFEDQVALDALTCAGVEPNLDDVRSRVTFVVAGSPVVGGVGAP